MSPLSPALDAQLIETVVHALPGIVRAISATRNSISPGLRTAQARALLRVASAEGLTMGELARQIGVSYAAATQVIDQLVDLGLVARERCEDDRRIVRLRLTPAARPEIAQALDRRRRQIEEVCARLGPEGARGFARGMQLLAEVLADDAAVQGHAAVGETTVGE